MADSIINTLSICSGVGMLDVGVHAGLERLAIKSRTTAYAEWDAYAASQLVALMEAGCLDAAPVWCGDLGRIDGQSLRGRVDAVIGGFPCQPHSVAGKREGTNDERWIWPAIVDLIRDTGAWLVVLENVRGLLSSGGMGPVLADLSGIGFHAEWTVLSAGEVGASHRRERVFIVGVANGQSGRFRELRESSGRDGQADGDHAQLEYAARHEQCGGRGRRVSKGSGALAQRSEPAEGCGGLADSMREGLQRGKRGSWIDAKQWRGAHGPTSERGGLFAPGPSNPRWPDILRERPWLAPATKSGLCSVVDGVALVVDESRRDQLRCVGNGVVPLQAAAAVVGLVRRLMA